MDPNVLPELRARPFRWADGERVVLFGPEAVDRLLDELGGAPYTLLTTERAAAAGPARPLLAGATQRLDVGPGRVDELAAELRPVVAHDLLVALGGGRVIDTGKALGAADPPRRLAAVPTTLSGAEMTGVHRHAAGVPEATPRLRPQLVASVPALVASQPPQARAGSLANALGHAAEGPLTVLCSPLPALAALQAARLIAVSAPGPDELDDQRRDALALSALLAGYAIDSPGYGLHHILAQTLVRVAGLGHGQANAVMLPHTLGALRERDAVGVARLDAATGGDAALLARRLAHAAGATSLRELDVEATVLDRCADAAASRAELNLIPPAPDRDELRTLYAAAT